MSISLSPSYQRSLVALGYKATSTNQLSEQETKQLITWLEETKIRLLLPEERDGLRKLSPKHHDKWVESFGDYLKVLGILPPTSAGRIPDTFEWNSVEFRQHIVSRLISYAIQDEYLDLEKTCHITAAEVTSQCRESAEFELFNCATYINKLLERFNLPLLPTELNELTLKKMASALEAVEARIVLPECTDTHQPNLELPLGFQIEDQELRDFCVALRLVHISAVRKLQHHISETLAALQSITGDPKTDIK